MADFLAAGPSNTSGDASEFECTLNRNINDILSILESPSGTPTGTPVKTTPGTPKSNILEGVVAHVEVRTNNDNRSRAVERELQQLGATIADKLTPEVTHVVFKDGKKSTRMRAEKRQLHLVSVLWLESCKQNNARVSESLYPVRAVEETTPVIARLKKSKSMQPKDFSEDVANSAERGMKRRRRQEQIAERWKKAIPNSPSLRRFFVEETQPRSPCDFAASPNITIPDTPPSMRDRMDSIQRKQLAEESNYPSKTPHVTKKDSSPLQRRLFGSVDGAPNSPIVIAPLEITPVSSCGTSPAASPRLSRASSREAGSPYTKLQEKSPPSTPQCSPGSRGRLRSQSPETDDSPSLRKRLKARLSGMVNSPLYGKTHDCLVSPARRSRRNSSVNSPVNSPHSSSVAARTEVQGGVDKDSASRVEEPVAQDTNNTKVSESDEVFGTEVESVAKVKARRTSSIGRNSSSGALTKPKGRRSVASNSSPMTSEKQLDTAGSASSTKAPTTKSAPATSKLKKHRSSINNSPLTADTSAAADAAAVADSGGNRLQSKRKLLSVSDGFQPAFPVEPSKSSEANKSKERLFEPKKSNIGQKRKTADRSGSESETPASTKARKVKSLSPVRTAPGRASRRKSMHPAVRLEDDSSLPVGSVGTDKSANSSLPKPTDTAVKPSRSNRRKSMNPALLSGDSVVTGNPADIGNTASRSKKLGRRKSKEVAEGNPLQDVTDCSGPTPSSDSGQKDKGAPEGLVSSEYTETDKVKKLQRRKSVRIQKSDSPDPESSTVTCDASSDDKSASQVKKASRRKSMHDSLIVKGSIEQGKGDTPGSVNRRTRRKSLAPSVSFNTVNVEASSNSAAGQESLTIHSKDKPARRKSMRRSVVPQPVDVDTQDIDAGIAQGSGNVIPSTVTEGRISVIQTEESSSSGSKDKHEEHEPVTAETIAISLARRQRHSSDSRDSGMSDSDSTVYMSSESYINTTAGSVVSVAQKGRKSIIEFNLTNSRTTTGQKKPVLDAINRVKGSKARNHSMSGVASELEESTTKAPVRVKKSTAKGKAQKSTAAKKRSPIGNEKKQHTNTIVMTSLHSNEQDTVRAVVKKLGGFALVDNVCSTTSHVICGNNRRTLNVLYGMVYGCWVLSLEWALKSLEAGQWLPEEGHEVVDFFPVVQVCRQERQACQGTYKQQLFQESGPIFVADNTCPPSKHLVKLLTLAGAQVTSCVRKADLSVGLSGRPELKAVSEQWVLDSISMHKCLKLEEYTLGSKSFARSPSPDF